MSVDYRPPGTPLYLTPDSIPVGRFCRVLVIPDDPTWVGLVDGILSALTDPLKWRQFGALTPEETADAWQAMLTESWSTDDVPCCPQLSIDPATGIPQVSYDDGLTWYHFPEGPWVDDPASGPFAPSPPPLNKGSDEADKCQAAANATAVITQFYKETFGAYSAGVLNAILSVNGFLFTINQSLLRLIYPDAEQLGIANAWSDFPWDEHFEEPTLDSDQQRDLQCLLLSNATVTDGVVTFDQSAVDAALDDVFGEILGTLLQLLVEYMAAPGLNAAGGVNAVSDPDCDVCGWTHVFDFTVNDGGWSVLEAGYGSYVEGEGWIGQFQDTSTRCDLYLGISYTETDVTSVDWVYDKTAGSGPNNAAYKDLYLGADPAGVNHDNPIGTNIGLTTYATTVSDKAFVDINTGTAVGTVVLKMATFHGTGENPFE